MRSKSREKGKWDTARQPLRSGRESGVGNRESEVVEPEASFPTTHHVLCCPGFLLTFSIYLKH
jgi:hypothetical protein